MSVSVNVLQFQHLLHFDIIFEKTWWPKLDIHPMRIEFPLHTPKYNESLFIVCRVWDQVKLAREASNTSELFDQVFGFLKCCTLSMKMLPLSLDGGAVFRVYTSKMLTDYILGNFHWNENKPNQELWEGEQAYQAIIQGLNRRQGKNNTKIFSANLQRV